MDDLRQEPRRRSRSIERSRQRLLHREATFRINERHRRPVGRSGSHWFPESGRREHGRNFGPYADLLRGVEPKGEPCLAQGRGATRDQASGPLSGGNQNPAPHAQGSTCSTSEPAAVCPAFPWPFAIREAQLHPARLHRDKKITVVEDLVESAGTEKRQSGAGPGRGTAGQEILMTSY